MAKKKQEELTNEQESRTSESRSGIEGQPAGTTDTTGGQLPSEGTGENTSNSGTSEGRNEGKQQGDRGSKEATKRNILQNIRNKRTKRHGANSDFEFGNAQGNDEGHEGNNGADQRGNEGNDGTATRTDSGFGGNDGQTDGDNTSPSGSSGNSETDRKSRVKPKGVVLDIPTLPTSKDSKKPITREKEEEPTLTKKEAGELKPRMVDALKVFFNGMDKTISMTTKKAEARNVQIWGTITEEEIEIIAVAMVETAQRVPVVSVAVRGITRNYQKYQMGIILLPRLIQSIMHYMTNGFGLNLGSVGK